MPLYQLKCPGCGSSNAVFRRVANRDENLPPCDCGKTFERIISAPYVRGDISVSFISPASGKLITSRAALENDLKATGHILNEPGLSKDIARNKIATREKAFEPIAAGVDKVVKDLVNSGQIESL